MKHCYVCDKMKDESNFYTYTSAKTGKKRYQSRCKECDKLSTRPSRSRKPFCGFMDNLMNWLNDYKKTLKCDDCPIEFKDCSWLLEFHHLDPTTKIMSIARMAALAKPRQSILEEIRKCIPLCANCHRTRHYRDFYLRRENRRVS